MTIAARFVSPSSIDRLRAAVMEDRDMQDRLASIEDRDHFLAAASDIATTSGIRLRRDELETALRPDPLGLDRLVAFPVTGQAWPGRHWLPAAIAPGRDGPIVDWLHFGGARLSEPFFEESLRRARRRPLNHLIRHRTPLFALASSAADTDLHKPDGFVFHMSRCGSTLVAQMLAAIRTSVVVSEAPVLDAVVQIAQTRTDLQDDERIAMLRAMIGALGRRRHDPAGPFVIKLDSWHSLALPLFRRAFPDTPWIFLYRDPLEVMVSQQRMRGLQTIAGATGDIFSIADGARMPADLYTAHVLARVCEAALTHRKLGGGLFVDYAMLPEAVETTILPHFGIAAGAEDIAAMRSASKRDAKTPQLDFAPDIARKQAMAGSAIRRATDDVVADVYRRLNAARQGAVG